MKAIPVLEAQGQLGQLIAEAGRGEIIARANGDQRVTLEPGPAADWEADSPELAAELLRAVNGPHAPLRAGELRALADRALREQRAGQSG